MGGTRSKCGRGLAPDGSGSVTDELADTPPSGASPLPQFDLHVSVEGVVCSGSGFRSAFDFDLRRPPKSLSNYGHTEPGRGAECWGKSPLVTLGLFSKVTRRKGGTNIRRDLNNGYAPDHKNLDPDQGTLSELFVISPHIVFKD
ncbi:hypothetical protein cym2001_35540 [Pseudomonas sp. CYM-20-01]|nr:hypothetical protein cym2001_35540 [Pseudomonas sp. CYM-20-01]